MIIDKIIHLTVLLCLSGFIENPYFKFFGKITFVFILIFTFNLFINLISSLCTTILSTHNLSRTLISAWHLSLDVSSFMNHNILPSVIAPKFTPEFLGEVLNDFFIIFFL